MKGSSDRFGIRVLDEHLSGTARSSIHLLVGGAGTGKSMVALQFLREGIRQGGRVALLTQAEPRDMIELARSIGIDLATHLRSGRWLMVGYGPDFRGRYRRPGGPAAAVRELDQLITQEGEPDRLAIDTCGPLIDGRDARNGARLLVEMLGGLRSTALLTLSAESPAALPSSFDLVVQHSAVILQAKLGRSGGRQFVVGAMPRTPGFSGPIGFDIRDGVGIVPLRSASGVGYGELKDGARRRIMLLDVAGELPRELRLWLEQSHDLAYVVDPVDAVPQVDGSEFELLALHVDRRTVDRGVQIIQQLRRETSRPPMLVMCTYELRATDRSQALHAGADDFLSGDLHPDELASRIEALVRRQRGADNEEEDEDGAPRQSFSSDARVMDVVRTRLTDAYASVFSLVLLRPGNGGRLDELASHVADRMRQQTGDVMTLAEDRVEVYLDGALARHAEHFLARIRSDGWQKVAAVVYTSPTDRDELLRITDAN